MGNNPDTPGNIQHGLAIAANPQVDQKKSSNTPTLPTKHNNKLRNVVICIASLILGIAFAPIYFSRPAGLFNQFFLFSDPYTGELTGILIFAILFTYLAVAGMDLIKDSTRTISRKLAYFYFAILATVIIYAIFSNIQALQKPKKETTKAATAGGFRIYKPNKNNPFNDLNEDYGILNASDKNCQIIEYTYYGSRSGTKLSEMNANATNCPASGYYDNQNTYLKYKQALGLSNQDNDLVSSLNKIGNDEVILVKSKDGLLNAIYGVKTNTLIIVRAQCTIGDDKNACSQKYEDFYSSLE